MTQIAHLLQIFLVNSRFFTKEYRTTIALGMIRVHGAQQKLITKTTMKQEMKEHALVAVQSNHILKTKVITFILKIEYVFDVYLKINVNI